MTYYHVVASHDPVIKAKPGRFPCLVLKTKIMKKYREIGSLEMSLTSRSYLFLKSSFSRSAAPCCLQRGQSCTKACGSMMLCPGSCSIDWDIAFLTSRTQQICLIVLRADRLESVYRQRSDHHHHALLYLWCWQIFYGRPTGESVAFERLTKAMDDILVTLDHDTVLRH